MGPATLDSIVCVPYEVIAEQVQETCNSICPMYGCVSICPSSPLPSYLQETNRF